MERHVIKPSRLLRIAHDVGPLRLAILAALLVFFALNTLYVMSRQNECELHGYVAVRTIGWRIVCVEPVRRFGL